MTRSIRLALALAALAVAPLLAASALAQPGARVRPWVPPGADSLLVWSAEVKARFQANTGDSIGGPNFKAYDMVGTMGRRLLRSMGRTRMREARLIEDALDSLGLDTSVATDPELPEFVLLVVHNPYRPTASSVGYLYWFRADDLRQQGVLMRGGRHPRMRVWWTSKTEAPYEWAIVSENPSENRRITLLLVRLNETGTFWVLHQFETGGPDFGNTAAEAQFVDVNLDGRPELSVWTPALPDSTFEECPECPKLMLERLYIDREEGYEVYDSRLMPSPFAAFTLFVRLLQQQNRAAAARLLEHPARITDAVAQGWGRRGRGLWRMEYAEPEQAWPRWLAFRFQGLKGPVRYIVRFTFKDGRWLISDWTIPRPASLGTGVTPGR